MDPVKGQMAAPGSAASSNQAQKVSQAGIITMSKLAMLTTSQLAAAIASAKHLKSLHEYIPGDAYIKIDTLLGDLELEKADRSKREKTGRQRARKTASPP